MLQIGRNEKKANISDVKKYQRVTNITNINNNMNHQHCKQTKTLGWSILVVER